MSSWKDAIEGGGEEDRTTWSFDDKFLTAFPSLCDFLAGEFDEKGVVVRSPGSVSIWIDEGRLKACFKIKNLSRVGFVALSKPSEGFHSLDQALNGGRVDWRKDGVRKRT